MDDDALDDEESIMEELLWYDGNNPQVRGVMLCSCVRLLQNEQYMKLSQIIILKRASDFFWL